MPVGKTTGTLLAVMPLQHTASKCCENDRICVQHHLIFMCMNV